MTQNSPRQSAQDRVDQAQDRIDRLDGKFDSKFNAAQYENAVFKGIDDFQSRLRATLPEDKHGKYLDAVAQNLEAITGPETLKATMQLIGTQLDRFEADLEANQEVMGYSREYMTGRERASNSSFEDIEDMPMAQLKEGYAYAPFLIKMMKDFEDWEGSEREAIAAKKMIDAVAVGLDATKAQLDRTDIEDSPAYLQLKEAYAEDLKTYVSVIANVDESFENEAFREVGKKAPEGESLQFERISKYSQEAIRVMSLGEGIAWVKDLMRQIDENDWYDEELKAAYGTLAQNCRMGLKAKLDTERGRKPNGISEQEYQQYALDLAKLFTDRGGDIDSNLVNPDFAAEMLKSSINFQYLAMNYAERQGKTNPLKAEISQRKDGVLSHIKRLPGEQQSLPQIQKAVELINSSPSDMKGLATQYAVIRSWEAQINGEQVPNIQQEVSDHMDLFVGEALQGFGEFLDSGTEGASIRQIEAATGATFSPEQADAYKLLAEIEGFGLLDLSDKTWNTTAEFAKVGAMIATGVALGIATGGAGFAILGSTVLGSAVVGGVSMTAAGAVIYQKGFKNWEDAVRVYGADLAINATGFGMARVFQAGRMAWQLRRAGMLDEAVGAGKQTRENFRIANQGGEPWKSLTALDDSVMSVRGMIGTRMIGASAEAVCDYGVSSICDTVVNTYILGEGSFLDNLGKAFTDPMNIGFLGVGVGMDLSPTVMKNLRAVLGKVEPETLHGMDQALNKAMNSKQHLAGMLKAEGIAWQDFARSSDPEATIVRLPADQQDAARAHLQTLRQAQEEFTDAIPELDLPAEFRGVDAGEARLAREGGFFGRGGAEQVAEAARRLDTHQNNLADLLATGYVAIGRNGQLMFTNVFKKDQKVIADRIMKDARAAMSELRQTTGAQGVKFRAEKRFQEALAEAQTRATDGRSPDMDRWRTDAELDQATRDQAEKARIAQGLAAQRAEGDAAARRIADGGPQGTFDADSNWQTMAPETPERFELSGARLKRVEGIAEAVAQKHGKGNMEINPQTHAQARADFEKNVREGNPMQEEVEAAMRHFDEAFLMRESRSLREQGFRSTDETNRINRAQEVIGRELNPKEQAALIKAHHLGKDGENLTTGYSRETRISKGLVLMREGGFNRAEAQKLMDEGIAGIQGRIDLAAKYSSDFISNLEKFIIPRTGESLSQLNQRKSDITSEISVLSERLKILRTQDADQYETVRHGGTRADEKIVMYTRPRPGTPAAQATERIETLKKQLSEVEASIDSTQRQLETSHEALSDARIAGTPDGIKKKIQELRQEREAMEDWEILGTSEGIQTRQKQLSALDRQIALLEKRLNPTRLAIGTMVRVPRSNGGFTEAEVVGFDDNGRAITQWQENGQTAQKAVALERLELQVQYPVGKKVTFQRSNGALQEGIIAGFDEQGRAVIDFKSEGITYNKAVHLGKLDSIHKSLDRFIVGTPINIPNSDGKTVSRGIIVGRTETGLIRVRVEEVDSSGSFQEISLRDLEEVNPPLHTKVEKPKEMPRRTEVSDTQWHELKDTLRHEFISLDGNFDDYNALEKTLDDALESKIKALTGDPSVDGIKGREFEELFRFGKAGVPDDRKPIVALDQHGELRVFANKSDMDFERELAEAKGKKPLTKYEGRSRSETIEIEQDNAIFREQLADKNQVSMIDRDAREKWMAANTDDMTGLYNRSILNIGQRLFLEGKKVAAVSFDGDNFGGINALKGTEYGDHMIQVMGEEFRNLVDRLEALGYPTHAGRMGGEEFVVFSENCPANILQREMQTLNKNITERIQATLSAEEKMLFISHLDAAKGIEQQHGIQQIGTSTSAIKVAHFDQFPENTPPAQAVDDLLHAADAILEAKKKYPSGKNAVHDGGEIQPRTESRRSGPDRKEKTEAGRRLEDELGRRKGIENGVTKNIEASNLTPAAKAHNIAAVQRNIAEFSDHTLDTKEQRKLALMSEGQSLNAAEFLKRVESVLSPRDLAEIKVFIESPLVDVDWRNQILAKHKGKITPEELDGVRRQYLEYAAQHEPSLGTLNPRTYEAKRVSAKYAQGTEFHIDPLQFKCYNEVLGHSTADRILEMNVDNLVKICNKHGVDPIFMKDLAKLKVTLPGNLSVEKIQAIQKDIAQGYNDRFNQILDDFSEGTDPPVNVRDDIDTWLAENQTAQKVREEPPLTVDIIPIQRNTAARQAA